MEDTFWCEIRTKLGVLCNHAAVVSVTYFQDGSGRRRACAGHIAAAIEEVATAPNAGGDVLRVQPIQAMSHRLDEIRRRRLQG